MNSKEIIDVLQPIADVLKVGVGELWKIFVKKYLVRGISEIVVAIVFGVIAYSFRDIYYVWIPLTVFGLAFLFDSINLIFSPAYFALDEIYKKVKENTK